jgi:hypothetical protein
MSYKSRGIGVSVGEFLTMLYDMATLVTMDEQLVKGQEVTVICYGGERVKRLVVADRGRTVVVCNEQEFHRAAQESREPDGVGFPRKDVFMLAD